MSDQPDSLESVDPPPTGIAAHAKLGGQRSAEARRKLTLPDIEEALGDLETVEDAQRWLRLAFVWSAAEKITGSRSLGMVGAIREWLKCYEAGLTRDRIRSLERELAHLKAERAARDDFRLPTR